MMKRVAALTLPVLLLLLAPAAYALPFGGGNETATGGFSQSMVITDKTVLETGVLITASINTTYYGGMVGVAMLTGSEMIYLNGSTTFTASGTFVGRIHGSVPGTLHEAYSGTGVGANFQGRGEFRDGTLGLAGLKGLQSFKGTLTSVTSASGTYTLLAHS